MELQQSNQWIDPWVKNRNAPGRVKFAMTLRLHTRLAAKAWIVSLYPMTILSSENARLYELEKWGNYR